MLCSASMAAFTTAAHAQGAAPPTAEPTQTAELKPNSGTPVDAGDIVVTATKRAGGQRLQDVPATVSAFDSGALAQAHVKSISDLVTLVPGTHFNSLNGGIPGINNFGIRGMAVYTSVPSATPTVGIFQDGVYIGTYAGVALNAFDAEAIEVLRGPQGLLFGRNVTAGAVLVRTTEPSDTTRIDASVGVESGPQYSGSAVISGPLTSDGEISGKIGVSYVNDTGYFHNLASGNDHFGGRRTAVVHAALSWKPTSDFTNVLRLEAGNIDGDGTPNQNQFVYRRGTLDFGVTEGQFSKANWQSAVLESRLDVGPGQLVNILGYRQAKNSSLDNIAGTTTTVFDLNVASKHHQFSNELRYSGKFGAISPTVGLYYYDDSLLYAEGRTNNTLLPPNPPNTRLIGGGTQESQTYAVFGNADIELPANFTLNLGARWSRESKQAQVQLISAGAPCSLANYRCTTYGFQGSRSWNAFTPKIGLQWQPTSNTNFYGFYTKGFRSGGYNIRQTSAASSPGPYDQETENTFEAGWKQSLFDKRLRFSVAVYRNDYKNLQRDLTFTDPVLGLQTRTVNAADARVQGVELEFTARPFPDLTISGNYAYIDAKYKRLYLPILARTGAPTAADYALKLAGAPKHSGGVTVQYDHHLSAGTLSSRISYQHVDKTFSTDANLISTSGRENIDLDLTFRLRDSGLSASFYVKNLLNNVYYDLANFIGPVGANPRTTVVYLDKARVFGGTLRYQY
jgi:iron complex outermembrane receptor protein